MGDIISELRVLQSAAGYYIGRSYYDAEYGYWGPYSRDSEMYFGALETPRGAKAYLREMILDGNDTVDEAELTAVEIYVRCLDNGEGQEAAARSAVRVFEYFEFADSTTPDPWEAAEAPLPASMTVDWDDCPF